MHPSGISDDFEDFFRSRAKMSVAREYRRTLLPFDFLTFLDEKGRNGSASCEPGKRSPIGD
jgi:hypothetical protein